MKIEMVASNLFISVVSLKRWCLLMEKNGYTFTINQAGEMEFGPRDIEAIKLISMMLLDGKELRQTVKEVTHKYLSTDKDSKTTAPNGQDHNEEITQLIDHLFELKMKEHLKKTEERILDLQMMTNEIKDKVSELGLKNNKIRKELHDLSEKVEESNEQTEQFRKRREDEIMQVMKAILETRKMIAASKENRWRNLWKSITQIVT